ncbi:unnamed protein product, partial [Fusarium langsethiae]
DPFDLGIHTPANLNRGARAALLQNSSVAVNGTIGVSPGPRRMAQTPSSPLNAATIAAATERAARANPSLVFEQQPVSIIESANDLARECVEEYNAKLMVFQAFCAKFKEAAQQFTTGPQRRFAQQFADSFLDSWKRELCELGYWAGRCLLVDRRVTEAVELLEYMVAIKETALAENHLDRLASQHALAGVYKAIGQIEEAIKLLEHVVAIKETTLAEDNHSRHLSRDLLQRYYERLEGPAQQ